MQLTYFTDYSLRVLIHLGLHPKARVTIHEIASTYAISQSHLKKVVNGLATLQYIKTIRGKGGGMGLAVSPDKIVIGKVVRATEGNMDIAECFDPQKQSCALFSSFNLKGVLLNARESFLNVLDQYTLADLLMNENKNTRTPQLVKLSFK